MIIILSLHSICSESKNDEKGANKAIKPLKLDLQKNDKYHLMYLHFKSHIFKFDSLLSETETLSSKIHQKVSFPL